MHKYLFAHRAAAKYIKVLYHLQSAADYHIPPAGLGFSHLSISWTDFPFEYQIKIYLNLFEHLNLEWIGRI